MSRARSPHCIDCGAPEQFLRPAARRKYGETMHCRTCKAPQGRWQLDAPERRGQPWEEFTGQCWAPGRPRGWTAEKAHHWDRKRFDKPLVLLLVQEQALADGYAPTSRDVAKSRRCGACHAPASAARPELVGASQLACPKCGAAASHWKKGVTVDNSLPADLRGRCKSEKQPKLSALEVRKKRAAAVERALQVARAERREPVSDVAPKTVATPVVPPPPPPPRTRWKPVMPTGPPKTRPFDTENAPVRHWKRSQGKIAESQREAAEWQERYERHSAGSNEGAESPEHLNANTSLAAQRVVRETENAHDPRAELLAAARSGDEHAQWRATELFGDSWRLKISNRVAAGARE